MAAATGRSEAALADRYPENDALSVFANAVQGAFSTAIGAAANESIASGVPVDLRERAADWLGTGSQSM